MRKFFPAYFGYFGWVVVGILTDLRREDSEENEVFIIEKKKEKLCEKN